MAGYSGTPLPQKLGIKADHRVALLGAPPDFSETLGALPERVDVRARADGGKAFDVIVWFVTRQADLERRFAAVAERLHPSGGLWVAWPKRASGVASDITEDTVRAVALSAGLVDNKVCAIDSTWSGLRCVVRLKDRPRAAPAGGASARQALEAALARSKKALAAYEKMSPSHRKEWLAFIEEAKRPETRDKRIRDVVRRIAEAG
jgi:hypothetical protein